MRCINIRRRRRKLEEEETYPVRLFCRNCEKDWVTEVDKGTYVRCEKDNNYMIAKNGSPKTKKYFTCPHCGANEKIARFPLEQRK